MPPGLAAQHSGLRRVRAWASSRGSHGASRWHRHRLPRGDGQARPAPAMPHCDRRFLLLHRSMLKEPYVDRTRVAVFGEVSALSFAWSPQHSGRGLDVHPQAGPVHRASRVWSCVLFCTREGGPGALCTGAGRASPLGPGTLARGHTHTHSHRNTHLYTHSYTNTCSCTLTFIYKHVHIRSYTPTSCKHTRTQTHAHTLAHSCTRSFNSSPHALILLASVPLQPFSSDITPVPSLWVSPDRSRALGAGQGVVSVGLSLGGTHGSQVFRVNPKARTMSELRGGPCAGHMGMSVSWPP